jgi:diguanylate cyclase (GGDEF)-like protein/PAS domain S-box-containing protein
MRSPGASTAVVHPSRAAGVAAEGERAETVRLLEAIAKLGAESELESVIRRLVQEATVLLESEMGAYAIAEGERVVTPAFFKRGEWVEQRSEVPLAGSIVGRVWQTGESYCTNDSLADPVSNHSWDRAQGCHSQLTACLIGPDGEQVGLATVFNSRKPGGFSASDERLLRSLCNHAGAIVRRARDAAARASAEREAAEHAHEVEVLAAINAEISASLDLAPLLQRIVEAAQQLAGTDTATIGLLEDDLLRIGGHVGRYTASLAGLALPGNGGLVGEVLARREPLQHRDVLHMPGLPVPPGRTAIATVEGIVSALVLPIQHGGESIGLLWACSRTPRTFTQSEIARLERLAAQAGIAIANARVRAREHAARLEAEALAEISFAISACVELDQVLQQAVEAARRLIGVDRAYLALCHAEGGVQVAAIAGNGDGAGRRLRVAPGCGVSGLILATGQPYQTADYLHDSQIQRDPAADRLVRDMATRSLLGVPIRRAEETAGVFWLASATTRVFTQEEVSLLERMAAQVAVAIENACVLAREQEARLDAETLLAASAALGTQDDPDEVVGTLIEQAVTALDAEQAEYAVYRDGRLYCPGSWREGVWVAEPYVFELRPSIVKTVWESGRPHRTNDLLNDPLSDHQADARLGFRSQLTAALLGPDQEQLGLVAVYNSRRPGGFSERDERLLLALCDYGSAVLRRARDTAARLEAEAQTARRRDEVAALLIAAERLMDVADPNEALFRVVEVAAQLVHVTCVALITNEGDELVHRYTWSDGDWTASAAPLPHAEAINGWVVTHAAPYRSDALAADPHLWHRASSGDLPRTILAVPILDRSGAVLAVLDLCDRQDGANFTDDDVHLAEGIARHAAAAIERTALIRGLRRSEEEYRGLFDHVLEGIFRTGFDGHFQTVNPALAWMLGYDSPAELLQAGRPLRSHYLDPQQDVLLERMQLDGSVSDFEVQLRRRDGQAMWASISVRALRDETGRSVGAEGIVWEITERKRMEAELRRRAFEDALTGLPNRTRFLELLGQALATPDRAAAKIAVLFLDLDGFKLINDSFGHGSGDLLLRAASERLRGCLRPSDTLARFGGDEFAVLLEALPTPSHARQIANRLLAALRQPFEIEGREYVLSASLGITECWPPRGETCPEDLLREADIAMYRAKAAGKARAMSFTEAMARQVVARVDLERDLRRALDQGELRLHYQPIVALSSGTLVGIEALVRWQRPGRGLIAPAEFIPLAEETGLILPLGRWVLLEACRQARAWSTLAPPGYSLRMSVNISARQFQQGDLVKLVSQALQQTGLRAEQLELELTESVLAQDVEATSRSLHALKTLGVGLAIDDFGTGYSSLSYLQRFPVDTLKVDRSFVSKIEQDTGSQAIVQAVTALARARGLTVTAEGIETSAQLARLIALGCNQGQGYYCARPMPPEAFETLLQRQALAPGPARPLVADAEPIRLLPQDTLAPLHRIA